MTNSMNIDSYLNMANQNFSNMVSDDLDLNFYGVNDNVLSPSDPGGYYGRYDSMPLAYSNVSADGRPGVDQYGRYAPRRGAYNGYSNADAVDGGDVITVPTRAIPAKQPTPYQVNVTNTTASTLTVVLFGMNSYLLTPNFGTSVGVTVTPAQSNVSYVELLQQSAGQPFETSLMRIQTSNAAQITQIISLTSKDANGQSCTIPIITQSYFSANQFQSTILDVPYPIKIDGSTFLTFPILANTTATYTLFPAEKVNIARNLNGVNQQQVYASPNVPMVVPMFAPRAIGGRTLIDPVNR